MTYTPTGRQIVVGVNGSAASAAAVRWAVREARLRGAALRLVCAYHSDTRLRAPYAPWSWVHQDDPQAAAKALLDRAAELAGSRLPPGRLITDLVNELPAHALLERSAGAEMLVLGTSRPAVSPGQPPPALGPVARTCLRRAPCPVVLIAPDDQPAGHDGPRRTGTLAPAGRRRSALSGPAPVPLE